MINRNFEFKFQNTAKMVENLNLTGISKINEADDKEFNLDENFSGYIGLAPFRGE